MGWLCWMGWWAAGRVRVSVRVRALAFEDNRPDDLFVAVDSIAPILRTAGVVADVDVFKIAECVFVFSDISA